MTNNLNGVYRKSIMVRNELLTCYKVICDDDSDKFLFNTVFHYSNGDKITRDVVFNYNENELVSAIIKHLDLNKDVYDKNNDLEIIFKKIHNL